jgi:dihydrofolate reductase
VGSPVTSTLIEGEVETAVPRLKAEVGPELQVLGSSKLLQTLIAHELIDEFRLWIFPVVVGPGKRLFGEATIPAGLTLVDSKVTTTGVIFATYRPAGRIQRGSFAFEEPTEREIERRGGLDA